MSRSVLTLTVMALSLGVVTAVMAVRHRHDPGPTLSVTGELAAFDPSRRDLVVRTSAGERHFAIDEDTAVHEGARVLPFAALAAARGCAVKVRFRNARPRDVAQDVRLGCPALAIPAPEGEPPAE